MSNVSPLPIPKERVEELVREIASDSSRVFWPVELEEETWRARVTNLQVQKCLAGGNVISGPDLDDHHNWTCKLECFASGSRVQTEVALVVDDGEQYLVIKDVFVF